MMPASELLKRGERDAVIEYFEMCRKFREMGGAKLDSWSETVRQGGTLAFAGNLALLGAFRLVLG